MKTLHKLVQIKGKNIVRLLAKACPLHYISCWSISKSNSRNTCEPEISVKLSTDHYLSEYLSWKFYTDYLSSLLNRIKLFVLGVLRKWKKKVPSDYCPLCPVRYTSPKVFYKQRWRAVLLQGCCEPTMRSWKLPSFPPWCKTIVIHTSLYCGRSMPNWTHVDNRNSLFNETVSFVSLCEPKNTDELD